MKTKIEHDNGILRGYFSLIMVINSRKVAGFNIIHKPVLDDGLIDLVVYRYIPLFNNLIYFISFIIGPTLLPAVHRIQTSKLKIYTDHHHKWNTDGEESNSGNLNIEVKKQAIQVIVRPSVKNRFFKEQ